MENFEKFLEELKGKENISLSNYRRIAKLFESLSSLGFIELETVILLENLRKKMVLKSDDCCFTDPKVFKMDRAEMKQPNVRFMGTSSAGLPNVCYGARFMNGDAQTVVATGAFVDVWTQISSGCKLLVGCKIGAGTILETDVSVGNVVQIADWSFEKGTQPVIIGAGSSIGMGTIIAPESGKNKISNLVIAENCEIGLRNNICENVKIGSSVKTGVNVTVLSGATIGSESIISSGIIIPAGLELPCNSIITHQEDLCKFE